MSTTPTTGAPPTLPEAVMFKKRRLFFALGLRNMITAFVVVALTAEVAKRAPWHSPLWCACLVGAYVAYYWLVAAKKTNVFYGASWHNNKRIRSKSILRPLPGTKEANAASANNNGNKGEKQQHSGRYFDFIARTLRTIPTLRGRGYKPTFFLELSSVQTMYATALRADPNVKYDRELVTQLYDDGEVCILDWSFSAKANDGWTGVAPPPPLKAGDRQRNKPAPVVVLFHGLTGGSDDSNMHYTTKILNDNGFHVVIPVRRGCADAPNLISRNKHYPYADEADTALAVSYISKKMAGHWLVGVGLSAGSNVLSMYLGTQGSKSKLKAGVSIANGYDWNVGTKEIVEGSAFWSTLMMSMVQYNLLRRHDCDLFNHEHNQTLKTPCAANVGDTSPTAAAPASPNNRDKQGAPSSKRQRLSSSTGGAAASTPNANNNNNLFTVVEAHNLQAIASNNSNGNNNTTTTDSSNLVVSDLTTSTEHPFVYTLVRSAEAAKRLVAKSVTHTQLMASYIFADDDEELERQGMHHGFDSDDECPTTTPFPYPFEPETFMTKKKSSASSSSNKTEAAATTSSNSANWYHDYSHFDHATHHINSTTTSDAAVVGNHNYHTGAFNTKVSRAGLRGALNDQFEKDLPKALDLAAAAAATYCSGMAGPLGMGSNKKVVVHVSAAGSTTQASASTVTDEVSAATYAAQEAATMQDFITSPMAALAHHQRHKLHLLRTPCTEPVVLKEHYAHVREYDELVSRRLHGYHDLQSFYDAQSCRHVIKHIAVPTFFLNALDDPVASANVIPYQELAANPNVALITTARGGHLGWADGLWPFPETYHSWLERFVLEILLNVRFEVECGRL